MTNDKELRLRWSERLYWAIVLLWAGLVTAADGLHVLPGVGRADVWNWIFLGAGLLALGRLVARTVSPARVDPDASDLGFALVLTVLGLGGFLSFWIACSAALVAVGTTLLIQALHSTATAREHPVC
jgi:hypothetical protein